MPVDPAGTPPVSGGGGSPDTAAQILTKLKTVDTDTSGLNSNFLQGLLPQEVANLAAGGGGGGVVKSYGSSVVDPDPSVPGVSQDVWAELPDTPEVVLTGVAVGDLIEVSFLIPAAGASDRATTWYDVASMVADAPVSSWMLDAEVTGGVRATGSRVLYNTADVVTGLGRHLVTADDLVDGALTLRMIYTTDHATFAAATTNTQEGYSSMRIDAVNLGQVAA